jgi:hypothetical protein
MVLAAVSFSVSAAVISLSNEFIRTSKFFSSWSTNLSNGGVGFFI